MGRIFIRSPIAMSRMFDKVSRKFSELLEQGTLGGT